MNVNPQNPFVALTFARVREPWQKRHNDDVKITSSVPFLVVARALQALVIQTGPTDRFAAEQVIKPLVLAGHASLAMPAVNLDQGTCSEWLDAIAELYGLEL